MGAALSAQDRLRALRLSLRFIAPLVVTLALLAYALVPLVDRLTLRWWVSDLDIRSQLIANTMEEQLADLIQQGAPVRINSLFSRLVDLVQQSASVRINGLFNRALQDE